MSICVAIFVCPSYYLIRALKGKAWMVMQDFQAFADACSYPGYRVYLLSLPHITWTILPTILTRAHSAYIQHAFLNLYYLSSPILVNTSEPFTDPVFKINFAESYLNFALSLDPNVKWDPINTLPQWPKWNETYHQEMVFNKTETDQPSFKVLSTPDELITRCK